MDFIKKYQKADSLFGERGNYENTQKILNFQIALFVVLSVMMKKCQTNCKILTDSNLDKHDNILPQNELKKKNN